MVEDLSRRYAGVVGAIGPCQGTLAVEIGGFRSKILL
jgi:hypothetical protein